MRTQVILANQTRAGPISLMDIFVRIQAIATVIIEIEPDPQVTIEAIKITEAALAGQQKAHLSALPLTLSAVGESIKRLAGQIGQSTTEIRRLTQGWEKETIEIERRLQELEQLICG